MNNEMVSPLKAFNEMGSKTAPTIKEADLSPPVPDNKFHLRGSDADWCTPQAVKVPGYKK